MSLKVVNHNMKRKGLKRLRPIIPVHFTDVTNGELQSVKSNECKNNAGTP